MEKDVKVGVQKVDVWNLVASLCQACIDGEYQNCSCSTTDLNKIQHSSCVRSKGFEGAGDSPCTRRKELDSSGSYSNSVSGEYISDDEFDDGLNNYHNNSVLLPSVTNWHAIDSILVDDVICDEHIPLSVSSKARHGRLDIQMVFVESESDKDSVPDVEVYYEDENSFLSRRPDSCDGERNIESRDSGYVTTDVYDVNIEHVTDDPKRRSSLDTAEEASRLLATLQMHEEYEEKQKRELEEIQQQKANYYTELKAKTVADLRNLKQALEERVTYVNLALLEELSLRDELNSQHQALAMNADDITKAPKQYDETAPPASNTSEQRSKRAKRRSLIFWR